MKGTFKALNSDSGREDGMRRVFSCAVAIFLFDSWNFEEEERNLLQELFSLTNQS
jgi:hypothetical protein